MKNFRRKMQMPPAADLTAATRSALDILVNREARKVGRDLAYGEVAKKVGASKSWVEKFLAGRSGAKDPRMSLFLRIRTAYEDFCARVVQEHLNELIKIQNLRRELDAPIEGFERLVAGQAGTAPTGASVDVEAVK